MFVIPVGSWLIISKYLLTSLSIKHYYLFIHRYIYIFFLGTDETIVKLHWLYNLYLDSR